MMCAKHMPCRYYLPLDMITKSGIFDTIMSEENRQTSLGNPWFIIDFCTLGFIWKLFGNFIFAMFVQFLLMFHNIKPGNWLVDHKPSLFQHIGKQSSLKGKSQDLKDKDFQIMPFKSHKNPLASIFTNLSHYEYHTIARLYSGYSFFLSPNPEAGCSIIITLTPPTALERIKVVTGNAERIEDTLKGGSLSD